MKNWLRKLAAAASAAVIAVSASGCMDNGRLMTVDGTEIRNGVYLYYQMTAYNTALNKIDEALEAAKAEETSVEDESAESIESAESSENTESEESSESSSSSVDYFAEGLEGKTTSDWIKDETLRLVKQFVAIQKQCEELGITLDQSETDEISSDLNMLWTEENMYWQYFYGVKTGGEFYENRGIGKDSIREIYRADALKKKLFTRLYDKDGETPVPDDEYFAFLKEKYAAVGVIELPFEDYTGFKLVMDKDKKDVRDKAEEYAERLNGGESIIQIKYETDLQKEQDEIRYQSELYYSENPVEGKTAEEYAAEEAAKATVDKAESEDAVIQVVTADSTDFDEDVIEYILSASDDGKASVYSNEDSAFIVVRYDITKRESWLSENRESVLSEMKGDDFENYLDVISKNYKVDMNSYLVNDKYKPEKLNESSSAG